MAREGEEKVKPQRGFPIHRASRTQNQLMMTRCSNYPMARTALFTLQRKPIKDKSFPNFISFTFETVVLLEILVPKILTKRVVFNKIHSG